MCMCGAMDCANCRPGVTALIECAGCECNVAVHDYSGRNWAMWSGVDFCPVCWSKKQAELKRGIEETLRPFVPLKEISLRNMLWPDCEGMWVTLVLSSSAATNIDTLLDALDAVRVLCDDHGLGVMVRMEEVKEEDLRKSMENAREVLAEWVAQYGCDCGHPACRACQRTAEARAAIMEETK